MPDQSTVPRAEPRPIVFAPKQPPRLLRRVVDRIFDLFLILLLVTLLASGETGPLLILAAIALGLSFALRATVWVFRRRDPGGRGGVPPREVMLSASLVSRVRALQLQDRRGEAARLLQGETDLSVADTARALQLVRERSESA